MCSASMSIHLRRVGGEQPKHEREEGDVSKMGHMLLLEAARVELCAREEAAVAVPQRELVVGVRLWAAWPLDVSHARLDHLVGGVCTLERQGRGVEVRGAWKKAGDGGRWWEMEADAVGDAVGEMLWEMLGGGGRRWEMVGEGGRYWEMVGDGGRWWEMVGDGGRCTP